MKCPHCGCETEVEKIDKARGTRLPEDWIPGPAGTAYCRERRPDLDVSEVFENFREYWLSLPGKEARKVDWMLTWQSWVRREKKR